MNKFTPPTVEECEERSLEEGLPKVQGAIFFDHHTARGWMLGKVKMKDWHAAFRTWKRNFYLYNPTYQPPVTLPLEEKLVEMWEWDVKKLIREVKDTADSSHVNLFRRLPEEGRQLFYKIASETQKQAILNAMNDGK